MKELLKISAVTIAITGIMGLYGCGGGGSGSSGGGSVASSLTSTGEVTGFGSVFVNGVEYETDGSTFSLDDGDDGPENEGELGIGMVVTITGTVNPDGVTGTASHIEYDDELEGIVISENIDDVTGTGTMDVMGQTVIVDETTIFESEVPGITGMGQIAVGHVTEVSGYPTGDGTIFASRVELELASHAGEEIEVKGIIENLTATTFTVGGLTVNFSTAMLDDSIPGGVLSEELLVEVKSTAGLNGLGQLIASEIELEGDGDMDHDGDEGDKVVFSGVVTSVTPLEGTPTEFKIGGQRVLLDEGTGFEHGSVDDIVDGVTVEAEGRLDADGALLAFEVEFEEESNIEMEGTLEAVSGTGASGTITLFGETLTVTTDTIMLDEQDEDVEPVHFFGLDDLVATVDYVEVDAHRDPDSGDLIADKIERDDAPDGEQALSPDALEGPVEDDSIEGQLTVAGVRVDVSDIPELPIISMGDEVEVEGSYNVGTGVFEAAAIEIGD